MTDLAPTRPVPWSDPALDALAARFRAAENPGVRVLNRLTGPAERMLTRLPPGTRAAIESATLPALEAAVLAASRSRSIVGDQHDWVTAAAATATGAFGGAGGLATAAAELPVTVTLMMRGVQAVAARHGFDPEDRQTRKDCLLAFAASGPLAPQPGADPGFLAARITLTGATVRAGLEIVAPRLALALGRKLAAQAVPVLGAATAAATNLSYCAYYRDMAHVIFGLRRMSEETGLPFQDLAQAVQSRIPQPALDEAR